MFWWAVLLRPKRLNRHFPEKCKNLLHRSCPHQKYLHLENNPYPEGHLYSYAGYHYESSHLVDFVCILRVIPLGFVSLDVILHFCFILPQMEESVQVLGGHRGTAPVSLGHDLFIHFFQRDAFVFYVKIHQCHCFTAVWAFEWIVAKKCVFLRHNPLLPMPPSVIRQWICGFHLRSLPKVCRTQMTPGVKSSDLLSLWNMRKTTLRTAEKRQFKRVRSSRKNCRRFSSMVKTQCRWLVLINYVIHDRVTGM